MSVLLYIDSDLAELDIAKFANLWLIYCKQFESMVYIFILVLWEIKYFQLQRLSKTSEALKSGWNFEFLNFK